MNEKDFFEEINKEIKKYSQINKYNDLNTRYKSIFSRNTKKLKGIQSPQIPEIFLCFFHLAQLSKQIMNHIYDKPDDYEPDLFKSCKQGKLTSIRWSIEKENGNKNKKYDKLLHIAVQNSHLLIAKYLIEKQNVDKDIKDYFEKTPLHIAWENGHLPIAEYLISKGANIEAKDSKEKTPLHYACEKGHLPIAEYLISKGSNIKAKETNGNYVIH